MFKYFLLILIFGCQAQQLPVIGLKVKPTYLRDIQDWSRTNQSKLSYSKLSRYPAWLRTKDEAFRIKVSLRGDLSRHWQNEKKSWRVWTDKDNAIWGMREFDLIIPEDKSYELEPVGYMLGSHLGLVTLKWAFVKLAINQRELGDYFLLERWTNDTIERQGLPQGEIILEANAWLDSLNQPHSPYKNVYQKKDDYNPLSLRIEIYKTALGGAYESVAMSEFSEMLTGLDKEINGIDVTSWRSKLNKSKFASWSALMVFMGSYHGVLGENIRWYYHPLQKNFQPTPYDFIPSKWPSHICPIDALAKINPWIRLFIKNHEDKNLIKNQLVRLVSPGLLEDVFHRFDQIEGHQHLNFKGRSQLRREILLENRKTVAAWLKRKDCF